MAKKVVVIGAVALGPKVACRLRRLDPEAEITLLDRDNLISYGGCGIPYYLSGDINDLEELYSTSAHVVRDEEFFKNCKGVNVLTNVEATKIDRQQKKIRVKYLKNGEEADLPYDKLVLATGASALRPPFQGSDLPNVFCVSDLHDAEQIKKRMTQGKVGKAVVIGGGAIGLEVAEALTDLWGIDTTLVEMEDQVLPTLLGKCIGRITKSHLEEKGVKVLLNDRVLKITRDEHSEEYLVETLHSTIATDMVVLSTGVRPNTKIARDADISTGRSGGILVDRRMRTNDPDIYAGGDCVELRNLVSGENMPMALGSLANRQGRIIATNINGGNSHMDGVVGTFCIKVFDFGICKAGLTFRQARETGFDPVYSVVSQADHAHFYPSSEMIYISLIADRGSRKILGIEAAGKHGDAVKARVDSVAVLLRKDVTIDDICNLETGYAPPFASAMDAINNAGNVLDNIVAGINKPIDAYDFMEDFEQGSSRVLDTRSRRDAERYLEKYGDQWVNIPQEELWQRYKEIPRDEQFYLICDTGPRAYEAQIFLDSKGVKRTRNVQGGLAMVQIIAPEFI